MELPGLPKSAQEDVVKAPSSSAKEDVVEAPSSSAQEDVVEAPEDIVQRLSAQICSDSSEEDIAELIPNLLTDLGDDFLAAAQASILEAQKDAAARLARQLEEAMQAAKVVEMELKGQISALQDELLRSAEAYRIELEAQRLSYEERLAQKQEEADELAAQIPPLRKQIDELNKTILELNEKNKSLQKQIDEFVVMDADELLAAVKADAERRLAELEARLRAEHSAEVAHLKNKAAVERAELEAEIKSLTEKLSDIQKKWECSEKRCSDLERELRECRDKIIALEAELYNGKDDLNDTLQEMTKLYLATEEFKSRRDRKLWEEREKFVDISDAQANEVLATQSQLDSLEVKHSSLVEHCQSTAKLIETKLNLAVKHPSITNDAISAALAASQQLCTSDPTTAIAAQKQVTAMRANQLSRNLEDVALHCGKALQRLPPRPQTAGGVARQPITRPESATSSRSSSTAVNRQLPSPYRRQPGPNKIRVKVF